MTALLETSTRGLHSVRGTVSASPVLDAAYLTDPAFFHNMNLEPGNRK